MIYAGFLDFGSLALRETNLTKVMRFFTEGSPSVIQKGPLTFCHGKISKSQDMDVLWEDNSSILIGRVFDKERVCVLSDSEFKKLSPLSVEDISNKIWGKYIYIKAGKNFSDLEVIIDLTGQLPFFYYLFPDGSLLFSSHIEIIFKILTQKPEYNWEYFCSYLIDGSRSSIQTPFQNIFELPPGCSLKANKDGVKTTPFWNPLSSYKDPKIQAIDAVDALQNTLKAWIEPYQTVCVSLSGGLDSSSLVYCLKDIMRKDQKLVALNYFHSQIKSSNELSYARKICEEANIQLIEVDTLSSLPFSPSQHKQPLKPNKPFPGLVSMQWQKTILDNIPSTDSFTFLSGHGSDHIFMRPPSQKSATDYILEKGIIGYKKQLKDIAQFYRDPLFSTFKLSFKSLFFYFLGIKQEKIQLQEKVEKIPKWIKNKLLQKVSKDYVHPIYKELPRNILPGKYDQVDALYEGIASIHMEMMNQTDPTFYPFLYEPITKFALSFPTYALFDKGYDRFPLRKAISERFKTETVWRRDKSQTTGLFQLGLKQNMERVLPLCVEGHFVKEGFIDKEGLQQTISLIGNGDAKNFWAFIHLASAEMFFRYWEEQAL